MAMATTAMATATVEATEGATATATTATVEATEVAMARAIKSETRLLNVIGMEAEIQVSQIMILKLVVRARVRVPLLMEVLALVEGTHFPCRPRLRPQLLLPLLPLAPPLELLLAPHLAPPPGLLLLPLLVLHLRLLLSSSTLIKFKQRSARVLQTATITGALVGANCLDSAGRFRLWRTS